MKLIVNPKTKKQEKDIKTLLENHSRDYIKLEDEAAVYRARRKSVSKKAKATGKLKDEIKEAVKEMRLIRSGKKRARNAEDFLNEL